MSQPTLDSFTGDTPQASSTNRPSLDSFTTAQQENSIPSQPQTLDDKLSDMPGLLGAVGSGIYNAGKGIANLAGSAVADTFQAINHPIDTYNTVNDFIGDELKGGADPAKLDTLGRFTQDTIGSKGVIGAFQQPGKVAATLMNANDKAESSKLQLQEYDRGTKLREQLATETDPQKKELLKQAIKSSDDLVKIHGDNITNTDAQIEKTQTDQGKIYGTALNSALTLLTAGEGNIGAQAAEQAVKQGWVSSTIGKILSDASTSFLGRAAQSGTIMSGFQAGSNLQEGRPITEGLKQSFFAGAATPGLLQGAGKVLNKVIPSESTISNGAEQLRKSIGFRGGNSKEKLQFEKAVPLVFDELKNSGFKLTDSSDPNNLVNLDKAVDERMTNLLQERAAKIEATGGSATVKGDLAAEKIRNLVEPGSVEDLTNPGMRDRLDVIAKNFEGKEYSPVDAQKAIIQANTGFSFSDNPSAAKQIKMAISQAFTPELDRIVGGANEIKYDATGKPIPTEAGTAKINKTWSAFKAFKDQLDKKLTIEDRKASYSLPDRLTGAEIAGKVGEMVGNPMKLPEKAVGSTFEYLANKVMGDRNNVNYRIYRAFNGNPTGEAIVGIMNKFQKTSDFVKLLQQNPLIAHLLEKIVPPTEQTEVSPTQQVSSKAK